MGRTSWHSSSTGAGAGLLAVGPMLLLYQDRKLRKRGWGGWGAQMAQPDKQAGREVDSQRDGPAGVNVGTSGDAGVACSRSCKPARHFLLGRSHSISVGREVSARVALATVIRRGQYTGDFPLN
jgi:hypothetical protein